MDGLDDLLKLLTCVKVNGWVGALSEDRYGFSGAEKTSRASGSHLPYSEPLSSLRDAIEDARVCLKAVDEAQWRLRKRLRFLRRLSKPLVLEDGIKRIPDEVLAIIFETGHCIDSSKTSHFGLSVSHVSRRFRRVSLQTPLLWTQFRDTYDESRVREFVSRSGGLDLEVDVLSSRISVPRCERAFKLLGEHSHRWCRLCIPDNGIGLLMTKLGITNLPRLRQLSYYCEIDLSTWSMPMLSHVEGWKWFLPERASLPSQITHFEFHMTADVDVENFALALLDMKNLKHLSLETLGCRLAEDTSLSDETLSCVPKPHSVRIEKLEVLLIRTSCQYSSLLFSALRYLAPSIISISLFDPTPAKFLLNSGKQAILYGSTMKFRTTEPINVMVVLAALIRTGDIVQQVHFDTRDADNLDWKHLSQFLVGDSLRLGSLRHLRFENCDWFTEYAVQELSKKILKAEVKDGLQSLEFISCRRLSEEFLLELGDEFGDRLKWTL